MAAFSIHSIGFIVSVVMEKKGRVSQWHGHKEIDESYKERKLLMEENIKLAIYHAKI